MFRERVEYVFLDSLPMVLDTATMILSDSQAQEQYGQLQVLLLIQQVLVVILWFQEEVLGGQEQIM